MEAWEAGMAGEEGGKAEVLAAAGEGCRRILEVAGSAEAAVVEAAFWVAAAAPMVLAVAMVEVVAAEVPTTS